MINKNNCSIIFVASLCVLLAILLVFSELFVSMHEHSCTGEQCVMCQITLSVKFALLNIACAVIFVACLFFVFYRKKESVLRETLVSRKLKLTI